MLLAPILHRKKKRFNDIPNIEKFMTEVFFLGEHHLKTMVIISLNNRIIFKKNKNKEKIELKPPRPFNHLLANTR